MNKILRVIVFLPIAITLLLILPVFIVKASETIPYTQDFESDLRDWTASGMWHIETNSVTPCPNSYEGQKSAYYGNSRCNYNTEPNDTSFRTKGELTSPELTIPADISQALMKFKGWYETEIGCFNCDKRLIEVKPVGGSWTLLKELKGESYRTWNSYEIDLSAYKGQTIQVRFNFDSVDGLANHYKGWYVDNVEIMAVGPEITITGSSTVETNDVIKVNHTLDVANIGNLPAVNVRGELAISAPFKWKIISYSSNLTKEANNKLTFSLGDLAANTHVPLSLLLAIEKGERGLLEVTGNVFTDSPENTADNNVVIDTPIRNKPPVIQTSGLPDGKLGKPYSAEVLGKDGDIYDALTMKISSLPDGLSMGSCVKNLNQDNGIRCPISGTPTVAGDFKVNAELSDSQNHTVSKIFNLDIGKSGGDGDDDEEDDD